MTKRLSTEEELPVPEGVIGESRARELCKNSPHARALNEIVESRAAEFQEGRANAEHEAAVAWDTKYKDVWANPGVRQQVVDEVQKRKIAAASKGQLIDDWHRFYGEIGEEMRRRMGLPSSEEQERYEVLEAMRRSRGQKT